MEETKEPKDTNIAKDELYHAMLMKFTLTGHTFEEIGEFLKETGRVMRGERSNESRVVSELLDTVALLLTLLQLAKIPYPNQTFQDEHLTDDQIARLVTKWCLKNRMGPETREAVVTLLNHFSQKVVMAQTMGQIEVYPHQDRPEENRLLNATVEVLTLDELKLRLQSELSHRGEEVEADAAAPAPPTEINCDRCEYGPKADCQIMKRPETLQQLFGAGTSKCTEFKPVPSKPVDET